MAKNGHVHEGGKVKRSNATPTKFFAVDSYDLKSLSFKFGIDNFITFGMPRVSYRRPIGKMNISMLFRRTVIRGPCLICLYPSLLKYLVLDISMYISNKVLAFKDRMGGE